MDPGILMKMVEIDVTDALTSDNILATHSGTGEGDGNALDILCWTKVEVRRMTTGGDHETR